MAHKQVFGFNPGNLEENLRYEGSNTCDVVSRWGRILSNKDPEKESVIHWNEAKRIIREIREKGEAENGLEN